MKLGDFEKGVKMYLRSHDEATEVRFVRYQIAPLLQIGDHYINNGQIGEAREVYLRALDRATDLDYDAGKLECEERLRMHEEQTQH